MRRFALLAVLVLAGCGGTHTTEPANTGSRNVTKPLNRAIGVDFGNGASVSLRRASSKTTQVTLQGQTGGASLELATGSCGAKAGLQTIEKLSGNGPWTVNESLTALTASPLAVVLRKGGKVVACGQVRSA
ncbi:MAG TPA: hypothetical protein VGK79_09550 [Gaiellaceae bacterium]